MRPWGRNRQGRRPVIEQEEQLVLYIRNRMREYLESGVPRGIPVREREKYRGQIQQLRNALHCCMYGAGGEKEYVKHVIFRMLEEMELTTWEREALFPLGSPGRLSAKQKFAVLLFSYMKKYGEDGL